MRMGIERRLMEKIPEIMEVEQVSSTSSLTEIPDSNLIPKLQTPSPKARTCPSQP